MTCPTISSRPASPAGALFQAIATANNQGIFDKIRASYARLPDTACARRGFCCALLPPLQPVEMLAWLHGQAGREARARAAEVARLVEHFLLNAAVRRPCPWALPRSCAMYGQRFFACRAYGLWSAEAYAVRREAALAAQTQVAQAWSRLGVELTEEVLSPGPEYCGQVGQIPNGDNHPMGDKDLERIEAELTALSQNLPGEAELLACGGDLAYLLARLALGEGQCLAAKVEVTKALLDGRVEAAASALNQHLNKAANWSSSWPKISS
jgi:hypothetical protein